MSSIPNELLILVPAYEKDETIEIKSFDEESKNLYQLNLYQLICSCPDWQTRRAGFKKGDMRRLCKHLTLYYLKDECAVNLTPLQAFFFDRGYIPGGIFKYISIEGLKQSVIINYDDEFSWWNIIFAYDGKFERYGYDPVSRAFAYGDKPHGYVAALRTELDKFKYELKNNRTEIIAEAEYNAKATSIKLIIRTIIFFIILTLITIWFFSK